MTGMDIVNKAKSYQGKYAKHNNKFTKYFKGKYNVQKNGYYKNGYCTLFVMYVYAQLGILSWMPKKTDHTQKMYSYLKKKGKIIKDPKKAKAGMPAFKKVGSTSKKSSGHTAIFWKYENGYVYTVDGNCGGGVVVRKKKPNWYLGFGNILKESTPSVPKYKVSTSGSNLNVRERADAKSKKITALKNGTVIEITQFVGNWGYSPKYKGYLYKNYLKKV